MTFFKAYAVLSVLYVVSGAYVDPLRIKDGPQLAVEGQFPFMLHASCELGRHGLKTHFSATMIDHQHVLTSATHARKCESIDLVFGTLDPRYGGKLLNSSQIFLHPKYNRESYENDVAIIRVAPNTFKGSDLVAMHRENVLANSVVVTSGWGRLQIGLQYLKGKLQNTTERHEQYRLLDVQYGFGGGRHGYDSGSPLLYKQNGHWVQIGSAIGSIENSNENGRYVNLNNDEVYDFIHGIMMDA